MFAFAFGGVIETFIAKYNIPKDLFAHTVDIKVTCFGQGIVGSLVYGLLEVFP